MQELETYDVCVVGAGAAGIIFTLEYAKLNPTHKILLIEYGDNSNNQPNELDDTIINKNTINHHDPYECTNKGFGGSTASWGGRCVMYDEVDFMDRPIIRGGCTWDKALFYEVNQYTDLAAQYFECGSPIFNINNIENLKQGSIAENFKEGDVTGSVIERWSTPTRFGKRYRHEILNNAAIVLLEGWELKSIEKVGNRVTHIAIQNISSHQISSIAVDRLIISAGTQESTRILLKNKQIFSTVPKSLGKYYQGHLSGKIATVKFWGKPEKTDYGFQMDKDVFVRRRFQFSTDFLVKNNLLNTAIWLDNPLYFDPIHKSGAMSFMYLAMITPIIGKKLAPPAIAHSVTKGKVFKVGSHIMNIIRDFPKSFVVPIQTFYGRYILKRKLPGVFLYSPENKYALHFHAEQIPFEGNQMSIAEDGKSLIIEYEILDEDINSVITLHEKLDAWLREKQCGELEYWLPKEDLLAEIRKMSKDGIHQSGTTRIGKSVEEGVVDSDLKVFGLDNLYVCSSSVFPTSGQANPTFYLGAFAARLAHYLST